MQKKPRGSLATPSSGKALAVDTPLPTPEGWTTMGEVQKGDHLLGADGNPTSVIAVTEVMYNRPCYKITFDDQTTVVADAEHEWLTDTRASRRSAQESTSGLRSNRQAFPSVKTTKEIAETVRCLTADRRMNHSVRNTAPLDLPERRLPVPPYTLGAWLGDGSSGAANLTTADPEMLTFVQEDGMTVRRSGKSKMTYGLSLTVDAPARLKRSCVVCGKGFEPKLAHVRTCGKACGGRARIVSAPVPHTVCVNCGNTCFSPFAEPRCAKCSRRHGSLLILLREAGVLGNKHIPNEYLRASISQRRALLAGLLDTDGTVNRTGSPQFAVTNCALAEGFRELVMSLGYRCGMSTKRVKGRSEKSSTCYVITFTTLDEVFRLSRKKQAHKDRRRPPTPRLKQRLIQKVDEIPSVPVRCVQVDHPSRLYLATRSMVPTHNSTLT